MAETTKKIKAIEVQLNFVLLKMLALTIELFIDAFDNRSDDVGNIDIQRIGRDISSKPIE